MYTVTNTCTVGSDVASLPGTHLRQQQTQQLEKWCQRNEHIRNNE